jgi:hypothetical protein
LLPRRFFLLELSMLVCSFVEELLTILLDLLLMLVVELGRIFDTAGFEVGIDKLVRDLRVRYLVMFPIGGNAPLTSLAKRLRSSRGSLLLYLFMT